MAAPDRLFKNGELVEVRPAAEILATLDGNGDLDGVPFMPEMAQFIGRRFSVTRRVEKICDTIATTGSRRMHNTVYLDDLRCDGSAHGGCQAGCRIYWKEAWLRPAGSRTWGEDGESTETRAALDELTRTAARDATAPGDTAVFRCQATEAFRASDLVRTFDIRQYGRELRVRNVGLVHFIRVALRGLFREFRSRLKLEKPTPLQGSGQGESTQALNLQPGEWVQVRSKDEIARTLDENGLTRGLSFDWEMLPYCGRKYRVRDRIERIIDDKTGRMVEIASDCVVLDSVVCSGERSTGRWFCPREIFPFWREAWLKRTEPPPDRETAARQS